MFWKTDSHAYGYFDLWIWYCVSKMKGYTGGRNVWGGWFLAGNQGNHQNWCGSTYMAVRLSNSSSKQAKNAFFVFLGCFCTYIGKQHDHIGWTTSMPFTSINSTDPRIFAKQFWELAILKNSVLLSRPFWNFFCSSPWKSVKVSWVSMMGQNIDDYPGFQPKIPHPKHFCPQ
jgi:hypothetical protein